jgi:glycosyltransferase involved in cell wall biosynthesis
MSRSMRVLIISYYFPPMGGPGVQRSVKFVKYLSRAGWDISVLTVRRPLLINHDESLSRDIPAGVSVVRTRYFDLGEHYAKADMQKKTPASENPAPQTASASPAAETKPGFLQKMLSWIKAPIRRLLTFPDRKAGWLIWAVPAALNIVWKKKPDVIYLSGDPFSSFRLGPILKFLTRTPYVLDFRDEWVEFMSTEIFKNTDQARRKREADLEKRIVSGASRVVSVTDSIIENFRSRYPREAPQKFVCIPNGYDAEDFAKPAAASFSAERPLAFAYVGTLGPLHFAPAFFEAFQTLSQDPSFGKKARLKCVGRIWDSLKPRVLAHRSHNIEFTDYLPHDEAVACLLQSDVCVLLLAETPGLERAFTGKLFEYVASGKPILAVTPEGEVSRFVKKYKRGLHALPGDTQGIQNALRELQQLYQNGTLRSSFNLEPIPEFERRHQAAQLAEVLSAARRSPKF